ncbi:hypothetical protein PRO82_000190 [Candidatus Protochlamydia amoebophila]|nr:hypothetical protein [Candidatus Protochlamydia amoebophila]
MASYLYDRLSDSFSKVFVIILIFDTEKVVD